MFDFGERVYEKPPSYKLWPTSGETVALVDADLLPYIVGFTTEDDKYAKAVQSVESGEYQSLAETPECKDAADHLDWLINNWVTGAGCDAAKLYVTDSPGNFRLDVAFTWPYKGQRPPEKPPFFAELKQHLAVNHNAIIATDCEADDLIIIEMHSRHKEIVQMGAELGSPEHRKFSDVVAISRDKDLRMCPGWHYDPTLKTKVWATYLGWLEPTYKVKDVVNYRHITLCKEHGRDEDSCIEACGASPCIESVYVKGAKKGQKKTGRVKDGTRQTQYIYKLSGVGLKFFYAQLLMGDSADNYPGVPGVGTTRAFEVLDSLETEEEMYHAVLEEYRKVYGEVCMASNYRGGSLSLTCEQLMVEQGRLAYMQTERGEVWQEGVALPKGGGPSWKE